jgi:hypothetical protein
MRCGTVTQAINLGLCVAGGRLFFQFCERPFLDTRQKQVRQELQDKHR